MLLKKLFKVSDPEYTRAFSKASIIGLHMVSGIAVGTAIGYALDAWLGTDPWLLIFFVLVGIVAGFKNVYVDTRQLVEADKNARRPKGDAVSDDRPPSSKN